MTTVLIPRNRDGSGWVRLTCSPEAVDRLLLPALAAKVPGQGRWVENGQSYGEDFPRGHRAIYYRCKLRLAADSRAYSTPRFALDHGHPKSALLVLAEHWTASGLDWIRIQDVTNGRWHVHRDSFITTTVAA